MNTMIAYLYQGFAVSLSICIVPETWCQRCSHSLFAFSTDALLGFNLCKEPCRC
ncbi:unnamed protein product [Rhodiola kirilowii]